MVFIMNNSGVIPMQRQLIFTSSVVLALAAITFATSAEAAVIRHHGGGHSAGGHQAAGRTAHRGTIHNAHGRRGGWSGGGGGWGGGYYGGYYDDYCGPIQLTLGLCGPFGL